MDPTHPALRANPFPEVTDLFCRLPLSTFFYRLEAVHLGDLMRLWVRPGVWINLSLGFSRVVESAPDTPKIGVLCQLVTLSPGKPIPGSWSAVKKKRELFPGLRVNVSEVACVATHYPRPGSGILTRFPFDRRSMPKHTRFTTELPYLLGSTNPCPIAVHMEPFSTSVFKVLIWIFATTTKICTRGCSTPGLRPKLRTQPPRPPTHYAYDIYT